MTLAGLEEARALSPAVFIERYAARNRPVVLRGVASDWPALARWTFPALRTLFGAQRVRVRGSDRALDVFFGSAPEREMSFADYLDAILAPHDGPHPYLGNFLLNHPQMDSGVLRLMEDFSFPDFFPGEPDVQLRIWVAGRGQQSTIHNDNYENLNAQVVGRKRFLLFAPEADPLLYPSKINANLWASPIDPSAPQLALYPRFAELQGYDCVLHPGDVLYIPKFWWHQAISESACINLNRWHYGAPGAAAIWENVRETLPAPLPTP